MTTATIAPPIDNSAITTGQKPQQRQKSEVVRSSVQERNTSANDTIDPRELDASRYQFRKQPNPKAKAELAESIAVADGKPFGVKGITNPLLVQTSRKAIIAGFTRHEIAIEFTTETIRQFTKGGMSLTSFVKNKLKLLNLPENILDSVRSGELHYTKAAAISTLEDPSRQELLDRSIEEGLSVREVKAEVAKNGEADRSL